MFKKIFVVLFLLFSVKAYAGDWSYEISDLESTVSSLEYKISDLEYLKWHSH